MLIVAIAKVIKVRDKRESLKFFEKLVFSNFSASFLLFYNQLEVNLLKNDSLSGEFLGPETDNFSFCLQKKSSKKSSIFKSIVDVRFFCSVFYFFFTSLDSFLSTKWKMHENCTWIWKSQKLCFLNRNWSLAKFRPPFHFDKTTSKKICWNLTAYRFVYRSKCI